MSTPKKGGKPIKITLTEGQITDIISQSARTRRGLKAESLEDRIAPSVIGAPLDPALVPTEGDTSGGDFGDAPLPPPLPGTEPLPYDPNLPPSDYVGGDPLDSVTPPLPGDPTFVDPALDPLNPLLVDPLNPDLPGGVEDPLGLPPLPYPPMGGFGGGEIPFDGPEGTVPAGPGQDRLFQEFQRRSGLDGSTDPIDLARVQQRINQDFHLNQEAGGPTPTPEELETHRRNILRQLRGAGEPPAPPVPPEG